MNMKKTVRVENMIKSLNDAKLQKNKNVDGGAKASVKNANDNLKKSSEEDIKSKHDRRAAVTWKHRESENSIFKPNSAFHYKDKISLSAAMDYSLRELTKESVKIFLTPTTKWFFDNCTVNIGIGSDKIVTRFSTKDGTACRFWEFCRNHRDNGNRLTIYLLTTSNSLELPRTDLSVINSITDARNNTSLKRQLLEENVGASATVKSSKASKDESTQKDEKSRRNKFQDKTSFEMNYPSIKFSSVSTSPKPSKITVSPKSIQSSSFILPLQSNNVCSNSKVIENGGQSISSKVASLKRKLPQEKLYKENKDKSVLREEKSDKKKLKEKTSFECNHPSVKFSSASTICKPPQKIVSPKSIPSSSFILPLKNNNIGSNSKIFKNNVQATSSQVLPVKKATITTIHSESTDQNATDKTEESGIEVRIPQVNPYELELMSTVLGQGGQGTVCLGKWKKTKVAIKRIRMKSDNLLLKREILMMERVRHENFINIMAVAFDTTHASLVMEYFESKSLWDSIFNAKVKMTFSDELKTDIGLQICNGINYLHNTLDNYIIHGDIKPANILINQYGQVKICDLGLAKCNVMQDELQTQANSSFVRGTSMYMAPELLRKESKPSRPSDVWAVGCSLLEMYSGESVWKVQKGSVVVDIINHMMDDKIPEFQNVPSFVSNSLKKSFDYDTKKRINIGTLLEVYRHEKTNQENKSDTD